jgi:hypothetical protein
LNFCKKFETREIFSWRRFYPVKNQQDYQLVK